MLEGELSNALLGTTVVIQIPDGHSSGQVGLHVPIGALFDTGKGPGVWVIQGEPAKVSWRSVAVQRVDDAGAYVAGQIKAVARDPGSRAKIAVVSRRPGIVALGVHLLREGEQVRLAAQTANVAAAGGRP